MLIIFMHNTSLWNNLDVFSHNFSLVTCGVNCQLIVCCLLEKLHFSDHGVL